MPLPDSSVRKKLMTTGFRVSFVARAPRNWGDEPPITCVTTTGLYAAFPVGRPLDELVVAEASKSYPVTVMKPAPPLVVGVSSPLKVPCLTLTTVISMRTPTAARASFAPPFGLATCHATPVNSAAARATAIATTIVRPRETTIARVTLPPPNGAGDRPAAAYWVGTQARLSGARRLTPLTLGRRSRRTHRRRPRTGGGGERARCGAPRPGEGA